ncbi:hypothetical protein BDA96_02G081500 [Sorghum bicolor]|uniref:Uncharacterized protein n=1 Tax=Sorghum bicolor TaxID=4558 RepID=A0A921URS5_SORBI|nr:hypothetical protein BDA96_02G081500 [Sorghum bicolor]
MGAPPPLFFPWLQLQLSLLSLHKNGFSPGSNPDLPLHVSSRHCLSTVHGGHPGVPCCLPEPAVVAAPRSSASPPFLYSVW